MTELLLHGHDYRCIQPCLSANQKIRIDTAVDCAAIDAWLARYFRVDPAWLPGGEPPAPGDGTAQARAVMERALVVYSELLRAATFPVFPEGRVLAIEPDAGQAGVYAVQFVLPVLDHLPVPLFGAVLKEAVRLVLGPLSTPPDDAAAAQLLDEIAATTVKTLKGNSAFEKPDVAMCGEAFRRGVPVRHLGRGVIRLGTGALSQLLNNGAVEADSAIGAWACGQKQLAAAMLRQAGFPTAEHVYVTSAEEAAEAAGKLGWPVVVKPEDRERSEGVTTDIRNAVALAQAYRRARELSEDVLVERHVPGLVHRVMVAGGEMIYTVKRLPKGVMGDGRRSVQELVDAANREQAIIPPWQRMTVFPLDDHARACLARDGLDPQAVPPAGHWARLRPIPSTEDGGEIVNLTDTIHPDNVRLALDAARLLGLSSAGVDIMSTDITRPWHETGAIINEVNFRPAFAVHKREAHAARLMPALVSGGGRIPVHLVSGSGDLDQAALELHKRLRKKGARPCLVSARRALDRQGKPLRLDLGPLLDRSVALLLRPDVAELIIAATPQEVFARGLATDRLESVWIAGTDAAAAEALAAQLRARFTVQTLRRT